jgi:hypothetical protein
MTTKPPLGLAASGHSDSSDTELEDLSDEIDVDSSQDVTVEASEESTLEVADEESTLEVADEVSLSPSETPPPLSSLMPANMLSSTPPPRRAPTLLGLPLPSVPLPGVTAVSRPVDRSDGEDDVTMMARPSIVDDEEEATKVEPAETAIHAAASRDDDDDEVTTALSEQASFERDRALRKSLPPSLDLPLPSYRVGQSAHSDLADLADLADLDDEFEDPEDDDVELAHDTPNAIAVEDDAIATTSYSADQEEPSSELEAVLAPRRPAGSPPLGSAIGGYGRDAGFGAARLPTPSLGYGFALPSPGPAPSNSPFSARLAPVGSPYATRPTLAPMPAIQIPAPSGAAAPSSESSWLFYKVQAPVVAVLALLAAAGGGGLLLGAKLWRSGAPTSTTLTALPAAPAPVVIQPVPPPAAVAPTAAPAAPSAAAPAAATAAAAAPAPAPTAAPTIAPVVEQTAPPPPEPKPVKHAAAVRKAPVAGAPPGAPIAPAAKPRPAKAKVAKGWVDPFAE